MKELRRYTDESVMPEDWHAGVRDAIKSIERLRRAAKRSARPTREGEAG